MWLVLPIFNGAAYIYENYVRKYAKFGLSVNPNYPEGHRQVLQLMSLDARKAVERYIERHGPDAFERVVRAVRCNVLLILSIFNFLWKNFWLIFSKIMQAEKEAKRQS